MRVSVYFNLHRRVFSIRAETGDLRGVVIAHADTVVLETVTCHVGTSGQAAVRASGVKNVHAFIRGDLAALQGQVETQRAKAAGLSLSPGQMARWSPEFRRTGLTFGYNPHYDYGFKPKVNPDCGNYITGARAALLSVHDVPSMLDPVLRPIPA